MMDITIIKTQEITYKDAIISKTITAAVMAITTTITTTTSKDAVAATTIFIPTLYQGNFMIMSNGTTITMIKNNDITDYDNSNFDNLL